MRTLVTGGAGFIGSHVARHCLDLGHEVTVLDDLSGGFVDQVPEGALFVHGSIADHHLVRKVFGGDRFDYVFHLAAYAAEGLSHFIRRFNYTNNLIGSVNLINEAVACECRCFVFTSSIAVYGAGQLPMTEDMTPEPEDPYGIAKCGVEMDLKAAHRLFGLNYIIFRPHNVYGEHQNIGDKYRNVIGIFMNQIMQDQPLTIFGDGEQTRAFTYIDDVAPHIARSVHIPAAYNQVFNIGADRPCTVNRLAGIVSEAFGAPLRVRHLPPRKEVVHAYSDHGKARRILDCAPSVSIEEGVARMGRWARQAGARKAQEFENIEVRKHLPVAWTKAS